MSYSEPRIAIAGNIVIDRIRYIAGCLPRKLKRPIAYAASEPMTSATSTLATATMAEFLSAAVKVPLCEAPLDSGKGRTTWASRAEAPD